MFKANIIDFATSSMAFDLAAADIRSNKPKGYTMQPSNMLKARDRLIVGFTNYFGVITDNPDGSTSFPINKIGMGERRFNHFDRLSSTVMQFIDTPSEASGKTARAYYEERIGRPVKSTNEKGETVITLLPQEPVGLNEDCLDPDDYAFVGLDKPLREMVADRIMYLAKRANQRLGIFKVSEMTKFSLEDLANLELECVDADEGMSEEVTRPNDHFEFDTDAWGDWDAAKMEAGRKTKRQLQLVDYDLIAPWLNAFQSWYKAAPQVQEELKERIEFARDSAREYVNSRNAGRMALTD